MKNAIVEGTAKIGILTAPAISGIDAAVQSQVGGVAWSNWALTIALGCVSYFIKRLIDKLDHNTERLRKYGTRLAILETKHDDFCGTGGRRPYDPATRIYTEED